jgi:hypothetical protein
VGRRGQTSRWQQRRCKQTRDTRGFAFIVGLALLALVHPAPALASGVASGLKAVSAPNTAVEPAQYRRRPLKLKSRKLPPRLKPGHASPHGPKSGPTHAPPHKAPPTLGSHKTPDTPGSHKGPDTPGTRLPPPKHTRDPRYPRFPPVLLPPDLPAAQAEVLQSLPRRMQEPPQGRAQPQRVAREILALVDASRPQSLGAELARVYGLELVSSRPIALLDARAELFRVRPGRSEAAALAALQRDARIRSAQFNLLYFHSGGEKRGASLIPQYGPLNVRLPEAHKLALGRSVSVAVIDSQVDTGHPDLAGAVVRSFDAVGGGDGAPDFHGTAVAGIIGSRGVVEAVAPQAAILAVRAFRTKAGALPETTTEVLLGAIDWAAGNGAKVLNLSFVGPRDRSLETLLAVAGRKGIVMVAAAGNAGPKAPPAYPAAYPGVIAVTAVDAADRRYQHANRGRYIAIAAPGVDVLAPVEGGKHELLSGTSFATAYVSGIAALLLERDPTLDAAAVARLIAAGADDLGPAGRDDDFGAGRVNALAALKSLREIAAR